jgi:hypothetical protein
MTNPARKLADAAYFTRGKQQSAFAPDIIPAFIAGQPTGKVVWVIFDRDARKTSEARQIAGGNAFGLVCSQYLLTKGASYR